MTFLTILKQVTEATNKEHAYTSTETSIASFCLLLNVHSIQGSHSHSRYRVTERGSCVDGKGGNNKETLDK